MLPASMHLSVAKDCLTFGKNMVTASYISNEMQALNEEVVKRTYWFHMTISDFQDGIPQISEDIEKIEWHSLATCRHCLDNTYPNIIEVIEAYRKKINL